MPEEISSDDDDIIGLTDKYRDDLMVLEGMLASEFRDQAVYGMAKNMRGDFCVPANGNVAATAIVV